MTENNHISPSVSIGGEGVVGTQEGSINPEFSKRITALRFVLVVFLHNKLSTAIHFADGDSIIEMPLWIQIIHDTFTSYWGGIAVPTFFIISGYLFFAKPRPMAVTIKSKLKSVVLPYVLWTFLAIFLFFLAQSFEVSKPYFTQPKNIIRNWGITDYLKALWAWDTSMYLHSPFVGPFWYVRNLIIMMLISPLIKYLAGKFPAAFLIFVTTLNAFELLNIIEIQYGFITALYYFTLGYYAVKYIGKVMAFLDSISWHDFLAAYLISFVLTIYAKMNFLAGYWFVYWFNLLFTIGLAIKVAGWACKRERLFDKLSYLSGFSFWIFASHLPFVLLVMQKLSVKIIPMHGIGILVQFFGVTILCIGILLLAGIALKRLAPKVFAVLTGGR